MKLINSRIYFVFGVGAGKLFPILFGLYLSRNYGDGVYAAFVLVLNYSAVIAAFSTMGAVPRILRASATKNPDSSVSSAAFASLFLGAIIVSVTSLYWLFLSKKLFFGTVPWGDSKAVIYNALFCFGLIFIALTLPVYSHEKRWLSAGLNGLLSYSLPFIVAVILGNLGQSGSAVMFWYVSVFFFCSFGFFFSAQKKYFFSIFIKVKKLNFYSLSIDLLKNIYSSLFGIMFLFGFYFVNRTVSVSSNPHEAALYSLGFQVFSTVIFIPSIFGSILIPKISKSLKRNKHNDIHRKCLISYPMISFSIISIIYFFSEDVANLYNIKYTGYVDELIVSVGVAAVTGSINAAYVQKFNAEGRFGLLALLSSIWLAIIIGMQNVLKNNALSGFESVSLSYIIVVTLSFIFLNFEYKKQHKS